MKIHRFAEMMRIAIGAAMVAAIVALTPNTADAQKAPWEIGEVKTSGKAVSPKGDEQTVFGADGKTKNVFLYVTVKYEKAPVVNYLRAAQLMDKAKKKYVGKLFNYEVDPNDKKSVTFIFDNNRNEWDGVDDLSLKVSGHTTTLAKKDPPPKK